jgi:hypothetical protein
MPSCRSLTNMVNGVWRSTWTSSFIKRSIKGFPTDSQIFFIGLKDGCSSLNQCAATSQEVILRRVAGLRRYPWFDLYGHKTSADFAFPPEAHFSPNFHMHWKSNQKLKNKMPPRMQLCKQGLRGSKDPSNTLGLSQVNSANGISL